MATEYPLLASDSVASNPAGPPPITSTELSEDLGFIFSGCQPLLHSSPMDGFCVQRTGMPWL